jgi:ParB-like chromosome segregation protein Spo0J
MIEPRVTAGTIPVYCAFDKLVPTDTLQPNPRNPNQHPDSQITLLAKVITAQGWRSPITVSKRSGLIVRGHGRYAAALRLGTPEVPVDY